MSIDTGGFTDMLLERVTAILENSPTPVLVGDGIAPHGGGWTEGQPGKGSFIPYMTVVFVGGTAQTSGLVQGDRDWMLGYSIKGFHATRKSLDSMMLLVRDSLAAVTVGNKLDHPLIGDKDQWQVLKVHYDNLGSVQRVDSVNPPYWQAFDAIRLECAHKQPPRAKTVSIGASPQSRRPAGTGVLA